MRLWLLVALCAVQGVLARRSSRPNFATGRGRELTAKRRHLRAVRRLGELAQDRVAPFTPEELKEILHLWETEPAAFDSEEARRLQSIPTEGLLPKRVIVRNNYIVPDTWVVQDMQLFFGDCFANNPVPWGVDTVIDTGTRKENGDATVGYLAFDNVLSTNWTADCKATLGGCQVGAAWAGLTIINTDPYSAAFSRRNGAFGLFMSAVQKTYVQCIRIYQAEEPEFKSEGLIIQMGVPDLVNGGWIYTTVATFDDLSGGTWAKRPAEDYTMWRVQNLIDTPGRWSVAELQFYEDIFCTFPLLGKPISSHSNFPLINTNPDSKEVDGYSSYYVTDGSTKTFWQANCLMAGCFATEAWVGLDFSTRSVSVRCVRMFQRPKNLNAIIPENRTNAYAIGLDRSQNGIWSNVARFWADAWKQFAPSAFAPTVPSPYFGLTEGGAYETTVPLDNSSWRVNNGVATADAWTVHELEFYQTMDCSGPKVLGTPISMQGPAFQSQALFAFDGSVTQNPEQSWTTSCSPCEPGTGWVGLLANDYVSYQVRCFRLFQSRFDRNQASGVTLMAWQKSTWHPVGNHDSIGGGSWNRRPTPGGSMWRIVNNAPVQAQWRVSEIQAFSDPLCLRSFTDGYGIANGNFNFLESMDKAMDKDSTTQWGANQLNCNETRKFWIGAQLAPDAAEITQYDKLQGYFLRCVQIWQSSLWAEQAMSVRVDYWDGVMWSLAPLTALDNVYSLAGGAWNRLPSATATRWRVTPRNMPDGLWRVNELEMYADPRCTLKLQVPGVRGQGTQIALNGFRSVLGAFDSLHDPLFSEANWGADGLINTSTLLLHQPSAGHSAWIGLDFRSEANFVRCIRLRQGSLEVEQTQELELSEWSNEYNAWITGDPQYTERGVRFGGLGGGGWQRRPAGDRTLWRFENMDSVPEGWVVYEAEVYSDPACGGNGIHRPGAPSDNSPSRLRGDPIASGFVPPENSNGPQQAFDKNVETAWVAQCGPVPQSYMPVLPAGKTSLPVGCAPGQAWFGLDLGEANPSDVKCVRIMQVGYGRMQSSKVQVSKWNGDQWQRMWVMSGLGGSAWDQRPKGPSTMWRFVYRARRPACKGEKLRLFPRGWGISDLKLYADDSCSIPIPGGVPITGGTIETFRSNPLDDSDYGLSRAMDKDPTTEWVANCGLGYTNPNVSAVDCVGSWFGLDFQQNATEIRCFKIQQSVRTSSSCCDPAEVLDLERWNGSAWTMGGWSYTPPEGATKYIPHVSRLLGARFKRLGLCKATDGTTQQNLVDLRHRRDSDQCLVVVTGATTLLGNKACVNHPLCVASIGPQGDCCPTDDQLSRCCCQFLKGEPIYDDEVDLNLNKIRNAFGLELAAIQMSGWLPYIGLALSVTLYIAAITLPDNIWWLVKNWAEGPRSGCCRKFLAILFMPYAAWRDYLDMEGTFPKIFRWFCLPKGRRPYPIEYPRALLWFALGAFFVGVAPWIGFGMMLGQLFLGAMVWLSVVVRISKSPFDPNDKRDLRLRKLVNKSEILKERPPTTALTVATAFAAGVVGGIAKFIGFMFDLLLCRAVMTSYGAIALIDDAAFKAMFPGYMSILSIISEVQTTLIGQSNQVQPSLLKSVIGLPSCRGSTVIFGSIMTLTVLWGVVQWINFDFAGLFAAASRTVASTRPPIQKVAFQAMVSGSDSTASAILQLALVILARALLMANPLQTGLWICPFEEGFSAYIGQGLILVVAAASVVAIFVCINGHFLCLDFNLAKVSGYVKMDLSELDQQHVGTTKGYRAEVWLSAIPSLFGVWLDWWNVHAFVIKARAKVYSEQLRDPQPCLICKQIHVDYYTLLNVTAKQFGLAVQILPYGVLVSKATNYLNDPPFWYQGKKLSCIKPEIRRWQPSPFLGKSQVMQRIAFDASQALRYVPEIVVPVLIRLLSLATFAVLMLATFTVTQDNMMAWGQSLINFAFSLSIAKGVSRSLGTLFDWFLELISLRERVKEGSKEARSLEVPRTIAGQAGVGAVPGAVVAICLAKYRVNGQALFSFVTSIGIGAIGGYLFSVIVVLVCMSMEMPAPLPGQPPPRSAANTGAKVLMGFAIALGVSIVFTDVLTLQGTILTCLVVAVVLVLVMKLVLGETKTVPRDAQGNLLPAEQRWKASPALQVLLTKHILPCLVAIPTAVAAAAFGESVLTMGDISTKIFVALIGSLLVSIILALALDQMLDQTAQLAAFFSGAIVGVGSGALTYNYTGGTSANSYVLVGVCCGAAAAVLVGSIIEQRDVTRILSQEKLRRATTMELDSEFLKPSATTTSLSPTTSPTAKPSTPLPKALMSGDDAWEEQSADDDDELRQKGPPRELTREEKRQSTLKRAMTDAQLAATQVAQEAASKSSPVWGRSKTLEFLSLEPSSPLGNQEAASKSSGAPGNSPSASKSKTAEPGPDLLIASEEAPEKAHVRFLQDAEMQPEEDAARGPLRFTALPDESRSAVRSSSLSSTSRQPPTSLAIEDSFYDGSQQLALVRGGSKSSGLQQTPFSEETAGDDLQDGFNYLDAPALQGDGIVAIPQRQRAMSSSPTRASSFLAQNARVTEDVSPLFKKGPKPSLWASRFREAPAPASLAALRQTSRSGIFKPQAQKSQPGSPGSRSPPRRQGSM